MKCTRHGLPFDDFGYCEHTGSFICSGWKQLADRSAELEKALSKIRDTYAAECPLNPSCIEQGEGHKCFTCTVASIADGVLERG
jgi:hypothetical protein